MAAIIGGIVVFFYNRKDLECIGVLFFKICSRFFRLFHVNEKSNYSGDFSYAEVLKGAKFRVGLRRDFFQTIPKVEFFHVR